MAVSFVHLVPVAGDLPKPSANSIGVRRVEPVEIPCVLPPVVSPTNRFSVGPWRNIGDFPFVAQVRQGKGKRPEDPYIAAVRDAFVRYDYQEATEPIPPLPEFFHQRVRDRCDAVRSMYLHSPPLDFDTFNTPERRKRYLFFRGDPPQTLPKVLGTDPKANSISLSYRGVQFTLIVGHPPSGADKCGSPPPTAPKVVIDYLDLPVVSQAGYCDGSLSSQYHFFRLEDHLKMLDDLVLFLRDIKKAKKVSDLEGEALYVANAGAERQLRFYLNGKKDGFVDRFAGKIEPVRLPPSSTGLGLRPGWECNEEKRREREKEHPKVPDGDPVDWAMIQLGGDYLIGDRPLPGFFENKPPKDEDPFDSKTP